MLVLQLPEQLRLATHEQGGQHHEVGEVDQAVAAEQLLVLVVDGRRLHGLLCDLDRLERDLGLLPQRSVLSFGAIKVLPRHPAEFHGADELVLGAPDRSQEFLKLSAGVLEIVEVLKAEERQPLLQHLDGL